MANPKLRRESSSPITLNDREIVIVGDGGGSDKLYVGKADDTPQLVSGKGYSDLSSKTTPIEADSVTIYDSEDSNTTKRSTIAKVIDTQFSRSIKPTPNLADVIHIKDTEDSNSGKTATISSVAETISSEIVTIKQGNASTADTGGDARGVNATDFQFERNDDAQVASGENSFIAGGKRNTASGSESFASGLGNAASGDQSVALGIISESTGIAATSMGLQNTASGSSSFTSGAYNHSSTDYSIAQGLSAKTKRVAGYAYSSQNSGGASYQGYAQYERDFVSAKTSSATEATMAIQTPHRTAGLSADFEIPTDTYNTCIAIIHGVKSDGTKSFHTMRQFVIANKSGTTALVGSVTTIGSDTDEGASGYSVSIEANNTSDSLDIKVTGAVGETVYWSAVVQSVSTFYG
jgi:hypothetical protein